MPTGYTADVASGKIDTLESFALACARGMGACITMRDDAHDAAIPERFEPSNWNAERINETKAQIERLTAMTESEAAVGAAEERTAVETSNAKAIERHNAQRARYEAMIAKVEAWTGAPEGIKDFMLSQLRESIRFDCSGDPYQADLPSTDGEAWRAQKLAAANKSLAYHIQQNAEEVARTDSRNAWLSQLRQSLVGAGPAPEQAA